MSELIHFETPSPNWNERQLPVSMVVLHYTGMQSADEALARLCDEVAQVSAHYLIEEDGTVHRLVREDRRAWHAGKSHYRGRDDCNDDSIGIELEGLEGQRFEDAQYETLSSLCAVLLAHYPIAHLAGHEHVAPDRKQDPGPGFDWSRLQKSLGLPAQCFPEAVRSQTTVAPG